jgi:hypothetical protein
MRASRVSASEGRCDCKVGRVVDAFERDGIDEELAADRRGQTGSAASLRDLAKKFNRAVLRSALVRVGSTPLDGEVANTYRLLTDDNVGEGTRIRARKRLESDGVDPEAVQRSFLSHPTMGSHLRECLGVERAGRTDDRLEAASERLFKMQSRAEAVIGSTIEGLGSAGEIATGDAAVTVDVQVMCEACGVYAPVDRFMDRGGCDCDPPGRD